VSRKESHDRREFPVSELPGPLLPRENCSLTCQRVQLPPGAHYGVSQMLKWTVTAPCC
jgi:hypothetical protein